MLQVGAPAPNFVLSDPEGNPHPIGNTDAPLTLAIFFKTSCPTCQYAWGFYERLHQAYTNRGLRVLGISQHDAQKTSAYRARYNATFPHLLDTGFSASRAYDPAFVPTGFLIDGRKVIIETFESWDRDKLNNLSRRIAETLGVRTEAIVTPEDNVLANKMG